MARARNIKPSFFTNELLAECSADARLLYIGLWTLADREGRLEDRPKRIKAHIFPFHDINVHELLYELALRGFIVRYKADSCDCIWIPAFVKHQHPHHREPQSAIPEYVTEKPRASLGPALDKPQPSPSESLLPITESLKPIPPSEVCSEPPSACSEPAVASHEEPSQFSFPTTGKGPREWVLSKRKLAEYVEAYPSLDVLSELSAARQWCRDNAPRRKTAGGMQAFLTRWMNKAVNERGGTRASEGRACRSQGGTNGSEGHVCRPLTSAEINSGSYNPITGFSDGP